MLYGIAMNTNIYVTRSDLGLSKHGEGAVNYCYSRENHDKPSDIFDFGFVWVLIYLLIKQTTIVIFRDLPTPANEHI